jgi:hypothetical protein
VHSADFATCHGTVPDPVTCRSDNGYEGFAFGGGFVAYTDDWTGHPDDGFNGLWLLADDYCGDDVKAGNEVCDGADRGGKTCASAAPAECAAGHCGPGWSGTLGCRADCGRFDDAACTAGVGSVQNLRRAPVR